MDDLHEQLRRILQGRACLVGVGNVEYGDDRFGVELAERLGSAHAPRAAFGASPNVIPGNLFATGPVGEDVTRGGCAPQVIVGGSSPERHLTFFTAGAFDTVLFFDAVEFGAAPGSVVLLGSREMVSCFPQVSTHKISLGLLAQLVEANGRTKVGLLGVQPQSLHKAEGLSLPVQRTLDVLTELLSELLEVVPESVGT